MRIDEIDKNFKVETELDLPKLKFYDPRLEPFTIYGVFFEDGQYRRMPDAVAETVNDGVKTLARQTAGGRIKFKTNSSYVAIHTKCSGSFAPHFSLTGTSGFDIYYGKKEKFAGTVIPKWDGGCPEYEGRYIFGERRMREITVNLPLYCPVFEVYIGLEEDAKLEKTDGYKYEKPIVYYGSSITQGGCASRPGNCYQAFITRALSTNYINLGFSGSARGEDTIAEYISELDMSIFVYDYDHNAPTVEHLEATHEKMFKTIRAANPDLPVVFLSRPRYYLTNDEKRRMEIVKKTYERALANGDKNVYFIPGPTLMKFAKDNGTVDSAHPTDLGFFSMAKVLTPLIKQILKSK